MRDDIIIIEIHKISIIFASHRNINVIRLALILMDNIRKMMCMVSGTILIMLCMKDFGISYLSNRIDCFCVKIRNQFPYCIYILVCKLSIRHVCKCCCDSFYSTCAHLDVISKVQVKETMYVVCCC